LRLQKAFSFAGNLYFLNLKEEFNGAFKVQKNYRLAKREDFNKVYRFGQSAANRQFVVYYKPQPDVEHFKLGISVSKKIGNAVVRNRMRRVIKEIVRHLASRIKYQVQIIIIVRNPAVTMNYQSLEKSIIHIMKKVQLIDASKKRV
jgi:ribonuclease P protein component